MLAVLVRILTNTRWKLKLDEWFSFHLIPIRLAHQLILFHRTVYNYLFEKVIVYSPRMEVGGWRLKVGGWKLVIRGWRLEIDSWGLEAGGFRLEV